MHAVQLVSSGSLAVLETMLESKNEHIRRFAIGALVHGMQSNQAKASTQLQKALFSPDPISGLFFGALFQIRVGLDSSRRMRSPRLSLRRRCRSASTTTIASHGLRHSRYVCKHVCGLARYDNNITRLRER